MTPTEQIIDLLENDPDNWRQGDCTLNYKNREISLWTANLPYINMGIYHPKRKTSFIENIRLQLAVNRWHKKPLNKNTRI